MAIISNINGKLTVSDQGQVSFNRIGTSTTTGYTFPALDGTANQILKTNGVGVLTFVNDENDEAVTKIIGGTNITVDPSDGLGDVTINADLAGTVTGTGTAGRVAYWTSGTNISETDAFRFDGTNVAIGGAIVASRKLAIYNTNADNELQFIGTDFTNIYSETDSTMAVEVIGDGALKLATKGGNLTIATGGGATFTGTINSGSITSTGQIICSTDTTTPSIGSAVFYKASEGAVVSGYQVILESGGLGARETALTISDSQKVGIGVAPASTRRLLIKGLGANATTAAFQVNDGNNADILVLKDDKSAIFSGLVGIGGTTSPNAPLDVASASSSTSGVQQWSYNSAASAYRLQLNTIVSSGLVKFSFDQLNNSVAYNNVLVFDKGNVGIGTDSPDQSNLVVSPTAQSANVDGITVVYNPDGATNRVRGQLRIDDFVGVLELTNSSDVISTKINAEGDSYFSGGDVGIGKTNPELKLDVESATDADLVALKSTANSNNTQMRFGISGNDSVISATGGSTGALVFKTYGSEAMRLTQGGTAEISGAVRPLLLRKPSGTTDDFFIVADNFTDNKFLVRGTGNVLNANNSYGGISDVKLKENIIDATPKLEDLMQVKIRNYNIIGDENKQIGVIAQELEEIFPSMIEEFIDYKEQINLGTTTKSVKYSVFVPMLIKSMQEQQKQIKELQDKSCTCNNCNCNK